MDDMDLRTNPAEEGSPLVAVADLVDNSVTANANRVNVYTQFEPNGSYVLISDDGELASLAVALINSSDTNVQLTVSWEAESGRDERTVSVPAGETLSLGTDDDAIVLEGVDAQPGSLFPVYFQYGEEEGQELGVPVLEGSLDEYAGLVPSEPAPSEPASE